MCLLAMPDTAYPRIGAWVEHLKKIVNQPDYETFFVAHSIGAQAVLRYLESLPQNVKVGGAAFIAPWFTLQNIEETEVVEPWLQTPIDFEKVKQHNQKFFAVFSDNDTWVPIENKKMFEQKLGAKTVVEITKGHFTEADGVREIPIIVEKILEMAQN